MIDNRYPRHARLWASVAMQTAGTDLAHDGEHVLRVYRWAMRLAPEAGADPDLAGAAVTATAISAYAPALPLRSSLRRG